ncbi:MAG: hypothetical protein KKE17_10290 [Proteobacteria bacterium]|nr:hypothetical protein [Pseudomonadota bacterium]MBU1710380.1 hypothetical protein [Pseudomonadota bacterium]
MQEIITALAAEGMTLARDVLTSDGRILCGKGTILNENLIDRLKKMEIAHIAVDGHPVEIEGEKTLEDELKDIEKRFSKVEDTPPLVFLKKCIMEKVIKARN